MISSVVVVPHHLDALTSDERMSLRHLAAVLRDREILWVMPEGIRPPEHGAQCIHLDKRHFTDVAAYSRLLLSEEFYRRFVDWDYLLIYQLDCLVFRDELDMWCGRSYDYIGAPLAVTDHAGNVHHVVGNGGFSLRRVSSCLDTLRSGRPGMVRAMRRMMTKPSQFGLAHLSYTARLTKCLRVVNEVRAGAASYAARYSQNEDLFWTFRARLFSPGFAIAPVHEAAKFAVETDPEQWYRRNNNTLPFGCHAWTKWDRAFWSQHLIPEPA